ncbi:hypothetical protein QBE53_06625 [Vallitaleaceae bacterium 9-2]
MLKNTEGSVLIEAAIIMPLCIICILTLIGMTIRYHYTITYDLYSDINEYYGGADLSATKEVENFYKQEITSHSKEKNRIKIIKQIKFIDDVSDQIQISSTIKEKYDKNIKKIQLILE